MYIWGLYIRKLEINEMAYSKGNTFDIGLRLVYANVQTDF